ncbi:MAG: serine--tRNA ligase [Thermodesulfobacteriota bacterium]
MLDMKFVRGNVDVVREAMAKRHADVGLDAFLELEARRRAVLSEVEALKAERNAASAEVGKRKRAGESADDLMARVGEVNERIKALDADLAAMDEQVSDWLLAVPNIPHESVPVGRDENDNPVVSVWGEPRAFDFPVREHWEIGAGLGGLDFERAAKLAGARFAVSSGQVARLERALAAFMLDLQTVEHGYREVAPPLMVNRATMTGTGQLPKFAADLFKLEGWEYFLIPTAEVPLTNMYRDEVLEDSALPIKFSAATPCFRSEAGSYGKDTKGLIRQHQFLKVEMVRIERPEESYAALESMRGHAEEVLRRLELPYRVITLCTGDMGFAASKTYDLEVWLPGQGKYREISSCSNCEDFQARRANIRYRPAGSKKPAFVHTLNGSGLAVGRALVAVLENCQQADGSVKMPAALVPYMGGRELLTPEG